jgi:hypothetical protein
MVLLRPLEERAEAEKAELLSPHSKFAENQVYSLAALAHPAAAAAAEEGEDRFDAQLYLAHALPHALAEQLEELDKRCLSSRLRNRLQL